MADQVKKHKRITSYGTETHCVKHQGGHEPDWKSVSLEADGDEVYVDVACRHCGRSGCLGSLKKLSDDLAW